MKRVLLAIPAYNEELVLPHTLKALEAYFLDKPEVHIVLVNNASTDQTQAVMQAWVKTHPTFSYLFVPEKGKGNALAAAFVSGSFNVFAFMDADLATDLSAWPYLMQKLETSDVVVGSRFMEGSMTNRSWKRSLVSLGSRWLMQKLFATPLSDFACGFKAFSACVIQEILPLVQNKEWFFDAELVLRAQQKGFVVSEIPVTWKEDVFSLGRKSKINVWNASWKNWQEMNRLRKEK